MARLSPTTGGIDVIDMHDPLIRKARNNRRLFIATIAAIVVLGAANLIDLWRLL